MPRTCTLALCAVLGLVAALLLAASESGEHADGPSGAGPGSGEAVPAVVAGAPGAESAADYVQIGDADRIRPIPQLPPPQEGVRAYANASDDPAGATAGQAQRLTAVGTTDEGFLLAPGGVSAGSGERVAYTIEIEPAVDADLAHTVAVVEAALHDERSWARDVEFERIEAPDDAGIRILLATPDTVDALCAEAELDTEGIYSCWNGTFAALNSARWMHGAHEFDDLRLYRRYLVNHEVGHGLGHAHEDCPAPGAGAPVMMQQTITVDACVPQGWPYPDPAAD